MWYRIVRRRRKRASTVTKHYRAHKELARAVILERVSYFNQYYNFSYNRIAIRNQRRCWGSCTSLKNLNFNYKLYFLPPHLRDYVIVHELCHLAELNHGKQFWARVAEVIPDYKMHVRELKALERGGLSYVRLEKLKDSTPPREGLVLAEKVK